MESALEDVFINNRSVLFRFKLAVYRSENVVSVKLVVISVEKRRDFRETEALRVRKHIVLRVITLVSFLIGEPLSHTKAEILLFSGQTVKVFEPNYLVIVYFFERQL